VADSPIYVEFEVNERDVLRHLPKRRLMDQGDPAERPEAPPVRLTLSDGSAYPLEGAIDFIDNAVDPATGTIRARAVFENPEGVLAAGLFVRIGLPVARLSAEDSPAIRVPAEAVQRDLGGSFVLVVGEGGVVERRPVVATAFREGADAILDSGLTAEDRVVVSHLQKVRAGSKVVSKLKEVTNP
jgi:RND family efflux transporter MFP subunit